MTLLLDVGPVPEAECNDCIEQLFKAMAEKADDDMIWRPLENPWLRLHVEEVTRRLQVILANLQGALSRALFGEAETELRKAAVPWQRWNEAEFTEVRFRLQQKPTSEYTLEDWLLLCEWLIARYLPDGVIQSEAEYLTVRAALLAKIQANMQIAPDAAESGRRIVTHDLSHRDLMRPGTPAERGMQRPGAADSGQARAVPSGAAAAGASGSARAVEQHIDPLVELVPTTFRAVPPRVLTPRETSILRIAKAQAAESIEGVADSARARMKRIVIEHVQAQVLGQAEGTSRALEQRLFDEFGALNRDFRRIAITEVGEITNQGVVAATPIGGKLRRVEAYRGACKFCQSINDKVFTVVDPADPDKNGQTQVWVGKTNVGRSAAPRRRVGNDMIERTPSELWWPAAGLQHPHCRGSWLSVSEKPPNVSQEFHDWLQAKLKEAGLPTQNASGDTADRD